MANNVIIKNFSNEAVWAYIVDDTRSPDVRQIGSPDFTARAIGEIANIFNPLYLVELKNSMI